MEHDYPPPLDQLLTLGEVEFQEWEIDYPSLGIGPEHVPDLVRMVGDPRFDDFDDGGDEDAPGNWAPVHAWRALGQLRAEDAVDPLLALLSRFGPEHWAWTELQDVFVAIGRGALPPLVRFLEEKEHGFARVAAAEALELLARADPSMRESCVAAITAQLRESENEDREVNAHLVGCLLGMDAVESAPVIEQAFADDRVDEWITGDWEDVRIELGLLEKRITPRPRYGPPLHGEPFRDDPDPPPAPAPPRANARAKEKAKRKAARQSRRKNRRR